MQSRSKKRKNQADERTLERLDRLLSGSLNDACARSPDTQKELALPWKAVIHAANGDNDVKVRTARELEDGAVTEERIRGDYTGRYSIELLQNAQDACADGGVQGKTWFDVTETALLVGNQGIPFDAARVAALLRLGGSSKHPGDVAHRTVGYKGIGFTSVFEISDTPQIISRDVAFGFNHRLALNHIRSLLQVPIKRVPARYYPFPLDPSAWGEDERSVNALLSSGAVTVVRLPFRSSITRSHVEQSVLNTIGPTTLLLMPALEAVEVVNHEGWTRRRGKKFAGGQIHHIRNRKGELISWFVARKRVPVEQRLIDDLETDLWTDVHDLEVLVGFPWKNGKVAPRGSESLHVYFPTEDTTGRLILIHADFFLGSSRRHIQKVGPGGKISRVAADGVADLVSETTLSLLQALPTNGPDIIRCLVPHESAQSYGVRLNEQLDGLLSELPILRSCGGRWVPPNKAELLGVELPRHRAANFTAMLNDVHFLTEPAFESAIGGWVQALGATTLDDDEVIGRLEPHRCTSYEKGVLAVAGWWRAKPRWPYRHRNLPLLQSTTGKWHRAKELCFPVHGTPPLPVGLSRAVYRPPKSREARAFLEEVLPVDEMTIERSLELVIAALQSGRYAETRKQCEDILRFMSAVYSKDPKLIRQTDVGVVPVPVRLARRGSKQAWRRANEVYFSRDWTGNNRLEILYGPFGEREFLDFPVPTVKGTKRRWLGLFRALGVADSPRRRLKQYSNWKSLKGWIRLKEVRAALKCPEGHNRVGRTIKSTVVDRLQQILDVLTVRRTAALVDFLSCNEHPYEAKADVQCRHTSHRGRSAGRRKAIGIQRWMLEECAWIPVKNDPLKRVLVQPREAWTHVNAKALQACVAQATVSDRQANRLRLPQMTQPRVEDVVQALVSLEQAYPDLSSAPKEVVDGAFQLLRTKVEPNLPPRATYEGPRPMFPCLVGTVPQWVHLPMVPDIEIPPQLGAPLLEPGPRWANIARVFSLPLASRFVDTTTEFSGAKPAEFENLKSIDRASLAALLHHKGADLRQLARRLGRLRIEVADSITTTYRYEGNIATDERLADLSLDIKSGVGNLVVIQPLTHDVIAEAAAMLSTFLANADVAESILLYLHQGAQLLDFLGVTETDRSEAEQAIRRYLQAGDEDSVITGIGVDSMDTGADVPLGEGMDIREAIAAGEASDEIRPILVHTAKNSTGKRTSAKADVSTYWASIATGIVFSHGGSIKEPSLSMPRATGAAGGTGRSGAVTISDETRQLAEEGAIHIAERYAREQLKCIDVLDVQKQNKGWDLEFIFGDNKWWPVEVKGFGKSAASFIITRNELEAARSQPEHRLLIVDGVSEGHGQIIFLRQLSTWLREQDLEAVSFSVSNWKDNVAILKNWTALEEK